jgi:hypothetical protein
MNEPTKKLLERAVYVVFFAAALIAVRTYKANHTFKSEKVKLNHARRKFRRVRI